MITSQTREKIRRLEIVTKRLMDGALVGDDISARRGYGVELDQLREYQFGDDVRFIDFKSSCRLNKMMIKECLEERNRRIILAVDVSSSSFYGSVSDRFATMQDSAAILAFAARYARDSVGLLLFSNTVECVIEPAHTEHHLHRLVQTLYGYQPVERKTTDMSQVLTHIAHRWHKDAVVFVISDFIVDGIDQPMRAAAACVDLIALRCYDPVERAMPAVGYLTVEDVEHDTQLWVNAQRGATVGRLLARRFADQDALFAGLSIDVLDLAYNQDVCVRLIEFFKRRMVHATLRYG